MAVHVHRIVVDVHHRGNVVWVGVHLLLLLLLLLIEWHVGMRQRRSILLQVMRRLLLVVPGTELRIVHRLCPGRRNKFQGELKEEQKVN